MKKIMTDVMGCMILVMIQILCSPYLSDRLKGLIIQIEMPLTTR
jgi:hypothetical protein